MNIPAAIHGSFLAVLVDDTHIAHHAIYLRPTGHAEFKRVVARRIGDRLADITLFTYAWGSECQQYTNGEVREVFFGE